MRIFSSFIIICEMSTSFCVYVLSFVVFFFKQKTAYEMRISDWSSDVCSSDLHPQQSADQTHAAHHGNRPARHRDGENRDPGRREQLHGQAVDRKSVV